MTAQIRTASGWVQGVPDPNGRGISFKGIPFAAPPIGEFRWRPPQAVQPWSGIRMADRYGPACIQPAMPADGIMRQFSFAEPPEAPQSEDCLYLNVWKPSADGKLPVLVWIFGGGHRVGSGSHPVSDGTTLAANANVIVVSVNYRVGALGYLAHPSLSQEGGSSGNYATMDLIAALRWIQENIAGFGGDPDCVTLFGQSAGAAHIAVLMASPKTRGLFHAAIAHSGGRFEKGTNGAPLPTLAQAEAAGAALPALVSHTDAEALRALDPLAITAPPGFWNFTVDGEILTDSVEVVFRTGKQADVPLISGYVTEEGTPYPLPGLEDAAGLRRFAAARFGNKAADFLALIGGASDDAASLARYALRRYAGFGYQAWRLASLHQQTRRQKVFMFLFSQAPPLPPGARFHEAEPPDGYGAYHGSELWYAFGNFSTQPWPWREQDAALSAAIAGYYGNFARYGDPNSVAQPRWPEFAEGEVLRLATPIRAEALPDATLFDFIQANWTGT